MPRPDDSARSPHPHLQRMLLFCLRCALKPSASGLRFSKLYQHFRERDFPYGLQNSLCTLTLLFRSPVTRLLNKINTRYGWRVSPYPTGTFTLQDTLSFPQRDNACVSRSACVSHLCAIKGAQRASQKRQRVNCRVQLFVRLDLMTDIHWS